jgi:peptidase M23B
MKKMYILTFLMMLVGGCSYDSGRIRLFNYNFWGGDTPSSVTVRKGDTLYSISRRYNVPMREMIEVNGLRPPYTLTIGRVLRLPAARYHVVAKGDTLYNISKRYNVDITSLSRSNRIAAPYTLTVGQRLVLPGSVVETAAFPAYKAASHASVAARNDGKGRSSSKKAVSSASTSSSKKYASSYTPPPASRKSKFVWPVRGSVVSSFGTIGKGRNNDGINIKAARGTAVKAADGGTVAYAGNELKGFGNLILIKHYDGWITAYAHNEKLLVKKGQKVARGEKIAAVGSTGGVSSPQLHFEIRRGKKPVNPKSYLP